MKKAVYYYCFKCVIFLLFFFFSASLSAATINVPADYASIRTAVLTGASNGDTIEVAAGTYYENVIPFNARENITITGAGETTTIINARGTNQAFIIANGSENISISGFTIANGLKIGDDGGLIYVEGNSTLTISGCTLSNGTTNQAGGAIAVTGSSSSVTLDDCIMRENTAKNGGAVSAASGATVTITDSVISSNTGISNGIGAAVYCASASTISISGTTISSNTSNNGGGAIAMIGSSSSATLTNCTIESNTANSDGGAIIANNSSTLTVTNSTISSNTTTDAGGGIFLVNSATGTITGSTFSSNTATNNGGAIACGQNSTVTITNCSISSNTATTEGGAIYTYNNATLTITGSTLSSNESSSIGGGIKLTDSTATIQTCTIQNNTAASSGAIDSENSDATVQRCTIQNNTGTTEGGINFTSSSAGETNTLTLENCLLTGNTAATSGSAALTVDGGTSNITNCTFSGNSDNNTATILTQLSTSTVKNCIIANATTNGILELGNTPTTVMLNNDFYGNGSSPYALGTLTANTGYTIEQINALTDSVDNIESNPVFTGSSNYTLRSSSPCINAASATGAPSVDRDGNTRPQGSGYDIGCYEYVSGLSSTWYLAEGVVIDSIDEYIFIHNSNSSTVSATITFFKGNATTIETTGLSVPAGKRLTVNVRALIGDLVGTSPLGAKIEAADSAAIAVERSMYGIDDSGNWDWAHCSIASPTTGTTWYMPEGTAFANTQEYLLCLNPGSTAAVGTFTLTPDGLNPNITTKTANIKVTSRLTYDVNRSVTEITSASGISTRIQSTQAIVAEMAIYRVRNNNWIWASGSRGSLITGNTWYFSEGSTTGNFQQYLLIQNPGTNDATITLTFYPDDETAENITKTATASAGRRLTYNVNSEAPETSAYSGFATKIESTYPVVAQASSFGGGTSWGWAHTTIGTTTPSTTWYHPEGSIYGGTQQYLLLFNPGSTDATVTLTFAPEDATAVNTTKTVTVSAGKRLTYNVNSSVSELSAYAGFSTKVSADQPIISQRTMYSVADDGSWDWAHCSIGIGE